MRRSLSILGLLPCTTLLLLAVVPNHHAAQADSDAKRRGAELFESKGCAHCHGTAGVGGGRGPDLQLVRKRLKPAAITAQIHDGGRAMPAFGETLTPAEMSDLTAFLSAKRKVVKVPPKPAEKPAAAPSSDSN